MSEDGTNEPSSKRMRPTVRVVTTEELLVLKDGCKTFLERTFGPDLVNPILDSIIPRPQNNKDLTETVDEWVENPDSFGVLGCIMKILECGISRAPQLQNFCFIGAASSRVWDCHNGMSEQC